MSQINLWKPFQTIYIEIRMKLGLGSHKVLFDCKLFKQHIICYIIKETLLLVNEANFYKSNSSVCDYAIKVINDKISSLPN